MNDDELSYVDPSAPLAQAQGNYNALLIQALRRKRTADTETQLAAQRLKQYSGPTVQSGRATLPNVSGILNRGVDTRRLNEALTGSDSATDEALGLLTNPRFNSTGNPALELDPDFAQIAKGRREDELMGIRANTARATGDPASTVQSVQQGKDGKLYGVMRDGTLKDLGLEGGGTNRVVDMGDGTHAILDQRGNQVARIGDQQAALDFERARANAAASGKASADAGAARADESRRASQTLFELEGVEELINAAPVGAGGAAATGTNRLLGRDSPGNDAQAQLDALVAKLSASIAKMLGTNPTDRDLIQARVAVGDFANPLRTRSERMATLALLRRIQERAARGEFDGGGGGDVRADVEAAARVLAFDTEAEAEAANLPRGTRITIAGRPATVQ